MAERLEHLERKYMEYILMAMDKPSHYNMLEFDISTKGLGQMYFMLMAKPINVEENEQDYEHNLSVMPQGKWGSQEKDDGSIDLLEVLQNNSRTIIFGEPGAGKTTSLFYLTILLIANYAKQTRISIEKAELEPVKEILEKYPFNDLYVPVFIKLSEIKEQHLTNINRFNDLIVQQVGQFFSNKDAGDLVEMWQREERLWLIMDGIDEMSAKARKDLLDKLRTFLDFRDDKNKITISSRSMGIPYQKITHNEKERFYSKLLRPYSICPLTTDFMLIDFAESCLKKVGAANYEEKAETLIEGMQKKEIINLMRTPMLLHMMIHVYTTIDYDIDQLPSSRVQLYDMFIHNVVLERGDLQKYQVSKKNNGIRFNQLMRILEYIAWFLQRADRALVKDDLLDVLEGYFKESLGEEDWFDIFSNQMRMLFINSYGEYEFSHRSYQEYFVARRLIAFYKENERGQRWVMNKIINTCVYSSHYRDVNLMFLKELSLDIQEEKRYAIMKRLYEELPAYHIIKIQDLFEEGILDPKKALIFEENTHNIIAAIDVLGKVKNHSQIKVLIDAFQNDKVLISRKALKTLGKDGDLKAVYALINALRDERRMVHDNESEEFGETEGSCTIDALIMDLQDEVTDVRVGAARALGEIGEPRAADVLIKALQDEDTFVRRVVTEALGKIGDSRALEALNNILTDEYEVVRNQADEALRMLGDKHVVNTLTEAYNDCSIRIRATEEFRDLGDSGTVDILIKALQDGDKVVRNLAAEALGKLDNEQAINALIAVLDDVDIKYIAQKALVCNGSPRVVDSLIETLQDDKVWIRSTAVTMLGKIGDSRAIKELIHALQNEESLVRGNAAGALGRIGDSSAVDALIHALQDEDNFVQEMAAKALGDIGGTRAMDALINVLKDTSLNKDDLYTHAIRMSRAIQSVGIAVVETLIQLLDHVSDGKIINIHNMASKVDKKKDLNKEFDSLDIDYDAYLYKNIFYLHVIRALGKIGLNGAVDILITVLKTDGIEGFVRSEVVNSLMFIGDQRTVEALLKSLTDKNWIVRTIATENLEKLGIEPEIVKMLLKEPKNRKLQEEALNILTMKTTLPILPYPEIPG